MDKNITRTFLKAQVNAVVYNKETGALDTETFVLENPGKDVLAAVRGEVESDVLSVISAEVVRVVSTRYTMSVADFIQHATVLDTDDSDETDGADGVEVST